MLLFTYGSLQKGLGSNHYLKKQKFIKEATITGQYVLYSMVDYPAIIERKGQATIKGEIWDISQKCLARLDDMEWMYKRKAITTDQGDPAFVYILPDRQMPETKIIRDGDWKNYVKTRERKCV